MENINKALHCCQILFDDIRPFLELSKGKEVVIDFRERILSTLVDLERKAYALHLEPALISDMKYAMVAFIDECVMYSEWAGRVEWMGRPLQLQYFGEHIAGENFFKKLSELRQAGIANIDLLEIYDICLILGFKGMYRLKSEEALVSLQAGLRSQIETMRGVDSSPLEKMGLPHENFVKQVSRTVPFWIILAVTLGIIFLIYSAYSIAIESQLNHVITKIDELVGDNSND